jgi:uncharacterized protein YjbI with pentapeptide repeats
MTEFEETREGMRQLVLKSKIMESAEFAVILANHQKFLESGGAGGHWQTFYIKNLIFGVYQGAGTNNEKVLNNQAKINFRNLWEIDLQGIRLQYADCVGILAEDKSWAEADLEGTLFIDSILNNCSFQNADLFACDFSRSEMRNCDFRGASLIQADFENCDLTGADFRGAKIDQTTKFKGAILTDALKD